MDNLKAESLRQAIKKGQFEFLEPLGLTDPQFTAVVSLLTVAASRKADFPEPMHPKEAIQKAKVSFITVKQLQDLGLVRRKGEEGPFFKDKLFQSFEGPEQVETGNGLRPLNAGEKAEANTFDGPVDLDAVESIVKRIAVKQRRLAIVWLSLVELESLRREEVDLRNEIATLWDELKEKGLRPEPREIPTQES